MLSGKHAATKHLFMRRRANKGQVLKDLGFTPVTSKEFRVDRGQVLNGLGFSKVTSKGFRVDRGHF